MSYVLLFIALNQTPAQLGTYSSEAACNQALYRIFEAKTVPYPVVKTPQLEEAVQIQLKYQSSYRCLPVDKN